MERWYIAFNTVGAPHDILNRLFQAVRQHRLQDFVVRFCYEKGAGRRRGQFYVFIGVASEAKGVIPSHLHHEFYSMLQRLRLSDHQLYVYFDDVQRMVSKELEIHNLRQIKMLKPQKLPPSDPYNFANQEIADTPNIEKNDAYNKLLYWLSTYGRGTWQQFRTACKSLDLDPNGEFARRIMRRFRSLGHVELTKNGQNWFIAPPALVNAELNESGYHTFLAGQRSPILIEELQSVASVSIEPQPYGDAPDVVRAVFAARDDAEHFVNSFSQKYHRLYLAGSAGYEIASSLPDLKDWQAQLVELPIVKGNYQYEQLLDGDFQAVHLPKSTGLYRLTHVSSHFDHPQLTLFYDADQGTWHKGDWYGLRYLMLRRTGDICEFHYDHNLNRLSIPLESRLPDMYERSLILASGRLPIFRNEQVIFGDVPETLAHILANKLEAEFIEYRGI